LERCCGATGWRHHQTIAVRNWTSRGMLGAIVAIRMVIVYILNQKKMEGIFMEHEHPSETGNWLRSKSGLILLAFLAIAAFFLFTEHRAHLFGILPFLLLLACPLLHFFHGGHGGHGNHAPQSSESSGEQTGSHQQHKGDKHE
jgi:hypothetical protein